MQQGGSRVAGGHAEEEGEELHLKNLMMQRNRIRGSLVGFCPKKVSYYY